MGYVTVDGSAAPDRALSGGLGYRPELDGMRAFAVLAVLVYHYTEERSIPGVRWHPLPGGSIGVDLFFVLSGYLITRLLIAEHERWESIDLKAFYGRRAVRLVPALMVMLAVVVAVYLLWNPFGSTYPFWLSVVSGAAYFADLASTWQLLTPALQPLWSLSIEEQFYLVWPALVIGMLRRRTPRSLGVLAGFLTVISLLDLMVRARAGHVSLYFSPDTHAAPLFGGSAMAATLAWLPPLRAGGRRAARVAGLAGIVVLAYVATQTRDNNISVSLLPVTLASIGLLRFVLTDDRAARFFAWGPFVWIGQRSYGIYLWHMPVFVVVFAPLIERGAPGTLSRIAALALSLVVAGVSLRFVERPLQRRWKARFTRA
ncbi:MAG: acyltransferase family protein [Acidimicrobiia bacterium]